HQVTHRAHDRLGELRNQLNGRVSAAGGNPADNYHCNYGPEVDFYNQVQNIQNRPDQQGEGVKCWNATAQGNKNQEECNRLNNNGQYQRGRVEPAPARDKPAQRSEQWIGRLYRKLGNRVVKIGSGQLQQKAQQYNGLVKRGCD